MSTAIMRPQDIVILLKIIVKGDRPWTQLMLARELFMSQSEISESLARSKYAGLLLAKKTVHREALLGFLVYGLPYVFPQQPGPVQRGIVTAHSAAPLAEVFVGEDPYVWPYVKGESRGKAITPLYPSVVQAVALDAQLHQLLALVVRYGWAGPGKSGWPSIILQNFWDAKCRCLQVIRNDASSIAAISGHLSYEEVDERLEIVLQRMDAVIEQSDLE